MLNLIKTITFCISVTFISNSVWADNTHPEKLGLNLNNSSDFAIYMMLYQIGLKDRSQDIFGDDSCIDIKKNSNGETVLSFGVKTDAFETGTAKFSKENDQKYKRINGTLTEFFDFFKNASYHPKVSVRSYADPQDNIMKKYDKSSALGKKYERILFGANSHSDSRFNTESKRKNYLLAYDRGENFIQNYFPSDMKKHIKTTPYHSPDLEVGNNQSNSEQFACPERRSIVVDMTFSPNFKTQNAPGTYTPSFEVASGKTHQETMLAAIFDAKEKKLEDLPEICRNQSSQAFINTAKAKFNTAKKLAESLVYSKNIFNSSCQSVRSEKVKSECLKIKKDILDKVALYQRNPSDEHLYQLIASVTTGEDPYQNAKKPVLEGVINRNAQIRKLVLDAQYVSRPNIAVGGERTAMMGTAGYNSSHFMDCFSNELFYKKEFANNKEDYIISVDGLRSDVTGEINFSYNADNLPTVAVQEGNSPQRTEKGYVCSACGNGIKLNDKKQLEYSHRAAHKITSGKLDHNDDHITHSRQIYESFKNSKSSEDVFLMGKQKGLNLYIVKGCDLENLKNATPVSFLDLKDKKIKVDPADCIFKPKIINSCTHSPEGSAGGEQDEAKQSTEVLSLLTGKNLEFALKANLSMIDDVLNGLKDDYINTCQINGKVLEKVQADPKIVIDNVLCRNRGIHIPKASFDAKDDCPEIAKRVLAK